MGRTLLEKVWESHVVVRGEGRPDLLYCYMGSLAMFQYHGPDGEAWKVWSEPLKRTLLQNQQEGFWPGMTRSQTVVQSSLATLALEVLYRYANISGTERPGEQR